MAHTILVTGRTSGFGRLMTETPAHQGYRIFAGLRAAAGRNAPAALTTFCCLHSVLSTWRKQGRSALDALEAVFAGQPLTLRLGS